MSYKKSRFDNKKRRHRRRKEVLGLFFIGMFAISLIYYCTYIYYSPITSSELPTIFIKIDNEIEKTDYVDCTFELDSPEESETITKINAKIKIRGSFNAEQNKKGYRIELSEMKSLLGMREDDDWQLLAMYMDLTDMRTKLSFDLWRSLLSTNPTTILPNSQFVNLYLNGEYQGLYLLAEKHDRRLFSLADPSNSIKSSLIFQSSFPHINFKEYANDLWQQDWPNEYDNIYIMDDIMCNLISFINSSSDDVFFDIETGIYSIFHKQNLIDFYIFNYFILHEDFWAQDFYIVRNTYPSKFFLIPWDFDYSFGQFLGRRSDPDEDPQDYILSVNRLYERLVNNEVFMLDCKNRWSELRYGVWSENFIMDLLTEMFEEIEAVWKIETKKWYPQIFGDDWEEEVYKAIDDLFEWIPERLVFCDSYFESQSF